MPPFRATFFDDALVGGDFAMTATGAQSRILLNLGGDDPADFNTADRPGRLRTRPIRAASFRVFENVATLAGLAKHGTVTETGTFTDSATAPTPPTPPITP